MGQMPSHPQLYPEPAYVVGTSANGLYIAGPGIGMIHPSPGISVTEICDLLNVAFLEGQSRTRRDVQRALGLDLP